MADVIYKQFEEIKYLIQNSKQELKEDIKTVREDLLIQTEVLKDNISIIQSKLNELECRVQTLEKLARKNNLMIFGLRDHKNLRDIELANWVTNQLKSLLGIDIYLNDINNIYYLGNDANKPLRIELNSYLKKALILRNAYKLKGKQIFIDHDLSKKERVVKNVLNQNLKEAKKKGLRAYIKKEVLVIGDESYNYEQLVERGNIGNESDSEVFTDTPARPSLSAPGTPDSKQPVQPIGIDRHKQETYHSLPEAKPTNTFEFTIAPKTSTAQVRRGSHSHITASLQSTSKGQRPTTRSHTKPV